MIVNGKSTDSEHLTDAILLGDGVFETLRSYNGRIYGLERHMERLQSGLLEIGFQGFEKSEAVEAIAEILEKEPQENGALRISIYSDGVSVITHKPYKPNREAISCLTYSQEVEQKLYKSASYSDRMRLRRIAQARGFDDVIVLDRKGLISELSTSNLILLLDGNWMTPSLEGGGLPGVTRAFLIENFGVQQAPLSMADIEGASAAGAVSSLREVQEIKSIDGKDFKSSNQLRELQESFSSWVLGNLLS